VVVLDRMIGFVVTKNPAAAREFYGDRLGFRLMGDDEFALVFDANGTQLRLVKAREFSPGRGTVLGWEVADIYAAIADLVLRGVQFEQFKLPFMPQDAHGVWTPSSGDRVAWFKDPDGNTLSLSQHRAR
jgi:catechol 2,3-dioxygenase-like lactoylglutathione lyase family enzyme